MTVLVTPNRPLLLNGKTVPADEPVRVDAGIAEAWKAHGWLVDETAKANHGSQSAADGKARGSK